jgi:6-pyruvoyl-tetrahydropterin synthase
MKRAELKKIIKPLVKECVQETILNDGLLSNIVSEVMQGMGNQFLVENKEQVVPTMSNENSVQMEQLKERQNETRKRLLDEIGKDSYNGVNLFEGTTPIRDSGQPSATAQANPMSGQDPDDAGVDISGILALGGKNWKALTSN